MVTVLVGALRHGRPVLVGCGLGWLPDSVTNSSYSLQVRQEGTAVGLGAGGDARS